MPYYKASKDCRVTGLGVVRIGEVVEMSELGHFHLPTIVKRGLLKVDNPEAKDSEEELEVKKLEEGVVPKVPEVLPVKEVQQEKVVLAKPAVKATPKAITGK